MNPKGSTNSGHANLTHKTRVNTEFEMELLEQKTRKKMLKMLNKGTKMVPAKKNKEKESFFGQPKRSLQLEKRVTIAELL